MGAGAVGLLLAVGVVLNGVFEEGQFLRDGARGSGDYGAVILRADEGGEVGEVGFAFGELIFAAAVGVGVGEAGGPVAHGVGDELEFRAL